MDKYVVGWIVILIVAILAYAIIVKLDIEFMIKPYMKKGTIRKIKLYITCLLPITVVYFLFIAGLLHILYKFV